MGSPQCSPHEQGRRHERLLPLYGQDRPWDAAEWVTSDDRVRGGASHSYMRTVNPERARFCGHLEITALGGAGFASQHSLGTRHLDLSAYEGIVIDVHSSDCKKYTLILKDQILPKRDDGRDQSSISWEYDFICKGGEVRIQWDDFKPTYRGRPKPDADPLDLTDIKRVAIMMRSHFGEQEGDFRLDMHSISAVVTIGPKSSPESGPESSPESANPGSDVDSLKIPAGDAPKAGKATWKSSWLQCLCSTSD